MVEVKKLYVEKNECATTSEIGKFLGFTTKSGEKGHLVFCGTSASGEDLHAIIVREGQPNASCGTANDNHFRSIGQFVAQADEVFTRIGVCTRVKEIYFFDTLQELYRWLGEE